MTIERPMFLPVDSTRRRFLTIVGAGSAVGIPTSAAKAFSEPMDPSTAGEGINLSANKINVLVSKTPSKEITPSQGIEGDPIFNLIEAHRKAHAAHMASLELQASLEKTHRASEVSWVSTKPCHDEHDAFEALIAAPATTLPSLRAKLDYMEELSSEFETEWMIEERADAGALFRSFAESIANITAVLSGGEV